jgi:steroid 5-alpha reductase family enzyme
MYLATVPVFIWAFRLAFHIWFRHKSEDYRYEKMRTRWEAKGEIYYYFASYTYVFMM